MAVTTFSNTVTADGVINSLETELTGDVNIQMVDGLVMTKAADKLSWANGELTFIVEIDNTTGTEDYTGVSVSDTLDPRYIVLVDDSVTLGGDAQSYTYNETTGELVIPQTGTLDIVAGEKATITFRCTKKV